MNECLRSRRKKSNSPIDGVTRLMLIQAWTPCARTSFTLGKARRPPFVRAGVHSSKFQFGCSWRGLFQTYNPLQEHELSTLIGSEAFQPTEQFDNPLRCMCQGMQSRPWTEVFWRHVQSCHGCAGLEPIFQSRAGLAPTFKANGYSILWPRGFTAAHVRVRVRVSCFTA